MRGPTDPEYTRTLAATLRLRPHEEVHLTTGPLYHSGPLAWALLTHALGGTVVLLRRFDAARWVELVREHRVTNTFTAPTPLKRIVSLPDEVLARADLSSMRSLIVNAAPVPYALKQEVIARFGDGFLFEVYGSTELGVDAVLPPEDQLRSRARAGRRCRRRAAGGRRRGRRAARRGAGRCCRSAPATTFSGYHGRERLADGWKSVGDIAHLDDEGYVYICDRKGHDHHRRDEHLPGRGRGGAARASRRARRRRLRHAVDGVGRDRARRRRARATATRSTIPALEAHVAERLADYKRPALWQVRAALPRTESGKLLKRLLRAEHDVRR